MFWTGENNVANVVSTTVLELTRGIHCLVVKEIIKSTDGLTAGTTTLDPPQPILGSDPLDLGLDTGLSTQKQQLC